MTSVEIIDLIILAVLGVLIVINISFMVATVTNKTIKAVKLRSLKAKYMQRMKQIEARREAAKVARAHIVKVDVGCQTTRNRRRKVGPSFYSRNIYEF